MKNQLLRINLTINEITKEIKVKILMGIANYVKNLLEIKIKDYIHCNPKSVKEIIEEIM